MVQPRILLGVSLACVSAGVVAAIREPFGEEVRSTAELGRGFGSTFVYNSLHTASAHQHSGPNHLLRAASASITIPSATEQSSSGKRRVGGFMPQQKFWRGGEYVFLGSGIRYHKFGWFDVKVYEGGLYVEQAAAAAELRRLQAEGFFRDGDYGTDRMCAALAAGNFTRVLQLDLLRSITGAQFSDALSKSLAPRVAGTDDEKLVKPFLQYFEQRSLCNDCKVPIMWSGAGALEVELLPPGTTDFANVKPDCTVPSQSFASAVYDIYLSKDGPLVGAREQWAQAARGLLGQQNTS